MNYILTLQHYPEADLRQLEEEIKESIDYLFGGKYRLKQVLDQLSGEAKKQLLSIVSRNNPPAADELNSLVILFEDILDLDETTLTRVFGDLDTEVVATSLVHMSSTYQRRVLETLPKGVQAMVDQWLSLKGNTASRVDIDQARQDIIQHAQQLEKEGFITINHD
jgi:flagellar motor switch protein FliG